MAVQVTFFRRAGSVHGPMMGHVRARESLDVAASPVDTTTATVQDGEHVHVYNGEASEILVAWGSTPDPSATASTAVTTAGVPVPATDWVVIVPAVGDKVAIDSLA